MILALKKIVRTIRSVLYMPFILADFLRLKHAGTPSHFSMRIRDLYPQIFDKTVQTNFDRHYVYHTAWAARVVREINPSIHIDIASSLYFPALLSAFIPVKFYDYRPANLHLDSLTTNHADLMQLPFDTESVVSLSCMHTVGHIGLGRYGDPIDPNGDIAACRELSRVLSKGGSLLFVTPVGNEAIIEFNAHRIYTYNDVLTLFPHLTLKEFSLIPENESQGGLLRHADPSLLTHERYACGCFWFTKT